MALVYRPYSHLVRRKQPRRQQCEVGHRALATCHYHGRHLCLWHFLAKSGLLVLIPLIAYTIGAIAYIGVWL